MVFVAYNSIPKEDLQKGLHIFVREKSRKPFKVKEKVVTIHS